MNSKRLTVLIAVLFVAAAFIAYEAVKAQMRPSPEFQQLQVMNTDEQLRTMLNDFLVGTAKNDPAAHDRFWADDLVYTGASGKVRTKAEIVQSVRDESAKAPDPQGPRATYSADDVKVNDFGNFAVVNFRLVAKTEDHGKQETSYYRNTGTFAKRNGQWKVVAWQATKIEPSNEPTK